MSIFRRGGRIWYYEFQHKGKTYGASTRETSKTRAAEVERERKEEVKKGRGAIRDITFDALAKNYLERHAANKRGEGFFKANVSVLRQEFDGMLLSEIGPGEIDAFMAKRRAKVKPATANRTQTVLKQMLKLAIRWGHASTNPAAGLKNERENNGREWFLSRAEADTLIEATAEWLRPLVVMALQTAARQGELLALTWGDVDFKRGLITFRMTKNGEPRTIKMSTKARAALKSISTRTPTPTAHVFRNRAGERLVKAGITWAWAQATKGADLDGFHFHDLRHTSASWVVQAGVPLNTLRVVMGHKSITMTLRYAHLAPDHQADAMAALDGRKLDGVGAMGVPSM